MSDHKKYDYIDALFRALDVLARIDEHAMMVGSDSSRFAEIDAVRQSICQHIEFALSQT
jgi:hypothetical protein